MISVYLDQNIYGHMLDEGADWKASESAAILLKARDSVAEVWLSPTHVIETAQATDIARRQRLAAIMLELSAARRMWWGHEFEAIREFFTFLRLLAPDAIRWQEYLDHRATTTRQIWLGALALLAACPHLDIDQVVRGLALTKTTSRLIHARFAVDPDRWVKEMVETVEQGRTTTEAKDEFHGMSLAQMEAEIDDLLAKARKLGKSALQRLNKQRAAVASAYGAMEIGALLPAIFTLPMEMSLVFDIPHLVERWPEFQKQLGCAPLPPQVREANYQQLAADPRLLQTVLQRAIHAAARTELVSSTISFQVVLRDLQKCINDRSIPTGGLVFDAGHAPAIKYCDIFMTADGNLADSLKALARMIETRTHGEVKRDVVMNAKQLAEAIERRQRTGSAVK